MFPMNDEQLHDQNGMEEDVIEETYEEDIIEMTDEEGNTILFKIIDYFFFIEESFS